MASRTGSDVTPSSIEGLDARIRSIRWVLKTAWTHARPLMFGMVSLTLTRSVAPAALAWVMKSLIDVLTSEIASGSPDPSAAIRWLVLGLVIAILDSLLEALNGYFNRRLSDELHIAVSRDVMHHAAQLDLEFFEDVNNQDVMQRAKQVTGARFTALLTSILGTGSNVLMVVSLSAVLIAIQPWTLVVIALVGPPLVGMRYLLARRAFKLEFNRTTKRRWSHYFLSLVTNRANVPEARLLGLAPLMIRKHQELLSEFRGQDRALYRADLYTQIAFTLVASVAFYVLLIDVALAALDEHATLGDVAVFFGASARLRSGVEATAGSIASAVSRSLDVSVLLDFFALQNRPSKQGDPVPAGSPGAIAVEGLHFTYPGTSTPALRGVDLRIEPGETVALVGENGSGKTTLVKLLARLYRPDQGCIRLDGRDIEELDTRSLHQQIAFIFQSFKRYEATAGENIAYGDWERCLDDPDRIEEAARAAGVHDMIMAMPEGYQTLLGRAFGTHELSGGQWQKLAVARAFVRPSSLLILDEPTAALDARAEYELFDRARALSKGRTTMLISHRFSTVSMADRILVMDEGQIIEQGTHADLLDEGGHYAELFHLHQRQMATAEARK